MKIVGCDLHTCYQQVAMLDAETGEWIERRRVVHISRVLGNIGSWTPEFPANI